MAQEVLVGIVHEPITKGLRDQITVVPGAELCDKRDPDGNYVFTSAVVRCELKGFTEACDAIDAIHAALERENEKLRKELKEWSIGAPEAMAFVDRLTDAAEKREEVTILGVDYTALPLDADGEPVHIGDELMEVGRHSAHAFVSRMELCADGWWFRYEGIWRRTVSYRHYHGRNVVDVLGELVDVVKDQNADFTKLTIAKYAECLQLVGGDAE